MKYERQQHSPLFIALQESKEKDRESSHTIHTPGQIWHHFFIWKEELHPIFGTYKSHKNSLRQASSFYSEKLNMFSGHEFSFLNTQSSTDARRKRRPSLCVAPLWWFSPICRSALVRTNCWECISAAGNATAHPVLLEIMVEKGVKVNVGTQLQESFQFRNV